MSVCAPCFATKPIPRCTTKLEIGFAAVLTAYWIFVKNVATGHTIRYSSTSSALGVVAIDDFLDLELADDLEYEIWVTLANTTTIGARVTLTLGTDTYTRLSVVPQSVADDDGNQITYPIVRVEAL